LGVIGAGWDSWMKAMDYADATAVTSPQVEHNNKRTACPDLCQFLMTVRPGRSRLLGPSRLAVRPRSPATTTSTLPKPTLQDCRVPLRGNEFDTTARRSRVGTPSSLPSAAAAAAAGTCAGREVTVGMSGMQAPVGTAMDSAAHLQGAEYECIRPIYLGRVACRGSVTARHLLQHRQRLFVKLLKCLARPNTTCDSLVIPWPLGKGTVQHAHRAPGACWTVPWPQKFRGPHFPGLQVRVSTNMRVYLKKNAPRRFDV